MVPGMVSCSWPLSKTNICGTLNMLYVEESPWLESTFNLPTLIFPLEPLAKSSITGKADRHVGHQLAQAKRSTGKGEPSTFASKLFSDISRGCAVNSSSVSSKAPHFPHFAPLWIFSKGILFRVLHEGHRKR